MSPADEQPQPRRPKKWLVPALCVLALLVVGIVPPLALSVLTGNGEWEKTQAELRARGEKLTPPELAAPTPPSDHNFFDDPMWLELTDVIARTDSRGIVAFEPRLPENQRQLAALDAPVPAYVIELSKTLPFPNPRAGLATQYSANQSLWRLRNLLVTTTDPDQRKRIAVVIIESLSGSAPLRNRIEQLLRERPEAVFPWDYSLPTSFWSPGGYFVRLKFIYKALADAQIALGQRAEATHDILQLLQLSTCLRNEHTSLLFTIRTELVLNAIQAIAAGLKQHLWITADLESFERELSRVHLISGLALSLRGTRAAFNQASDTARTNTDNEGCWYTIAFASGGDMDEGVRKTGSTLKTLIASHRSFVTLDQNYFNLQVQQLLDALENPAGFHPAALPVVPDGWSFSFTHFFSVASAGTLNYGIVVTCHAQDTLEQCRIACALEQYRLVHHAWPASLDALAPHFIPATSIIGRTPMHYRLEPGGNFRLWSVGWNETDESGISAPKLDYEHEDWLWADRPGPGPSP